MKKILLLLLTAITLSSCEKEGAGVLYDDGLVKSIEFQGPPNKSNVKYVIKYDDLDRVYSINDTVFFYGPDDKVIYSRYSENIEHDGFSSEKIIRKSYSWDQQKRLLAIHVDSVYQKTVTPEGILSVSDSPSFTEAYFYYSGFQLLPDSIGYNLEDSKSNIIIKKLYHANGNINKIEDIQMVDNNIDSVNSSILIKSTFFDYNEQNNYLYPLYQKLGFLPKSLGYVASKKMVATSESVESVLLDNLSSQLDPKRTTVKNIFTSNRGKNGYPTLIQVNSIINFTGDDYANAGSTSTYIHY